MSSIDDKYTSTSVSVKRMMKPLMSIMIDEENDDNNDKENTSPILNQSKRQRPQLESAQQHIQVSQVVHVEQVAQWDIETVRKLIRRTFPKTTVSKTRMNDISNIILNKLRNAPKNKPINQHLLKESKLSSESRQPGKQEILFRNEDNTIDKIDVYVPKSKIYDVFKKNVNTRSKRLLTNREVINRVVKRMTILHDCFTINASIFILIREITFQIFAREVSEQCGMYVPNITNIQFYYLDDDIVCDILMEKIQKLEVEELKDLSDAKKIELFTKTKRALNCLREHSIYHNDTHANNVLFRNVNGVIEPCLIDFGKANTEMSLPSTSGISVDVDDDELIQQDLLTEFNSWIALVDKEENKKLTKEQLFTRQQDRYFDGKTKYGGRTKKRNNNKKKKNTKKKSKTVKRMNTIKKRGHRRKTRGTV